MARAPDLINGDGFYAAPESSTTHSMNSIQRVKLQKRAIAENFWDKIFKMIEKFFESIYYFSIFQLCG